MSEFDWIERYFAPLAADNSLTFNLKNDAALLPPISDKQWVIASDTLIENVHFLSDTLPELIAQKALRVNLSDMAAMGATPYGYLLNLSASQEVDEAWISAFTQGLKSDQTNFNILLLGGDTTASDGLLTISITMLGQVESGKALTRNGAQNGDILYVSGTIGDAMIGLKILRHSNARGDDMTTRHQLPEPRIALGQSLANIASSCMDVSDGLLQDLQHICRASNVGAQVELSSIPLSDTAQQWLADDKVTMIDLLNGGDDYELLFTAPLAHAETLASMGATAIGSIVEGDDITCLHNEKKVDIPIKGYQHL